MLKTQIEGAAEPLKQQTASPRGVAKKDLAKQGKKKIVVESQKPFSGAGGQAVSPTLAPSTSADQPMGANIARVEASAVASKVSPFKVSCKVADIIDEEPIDK